MNASGSEALGQAQRAIVSARSLFREGLVPECHEYMLKAQDALIQAWLPETSDGSEPLSHTEQALKALEQARYRHPDRLRAALTAAQKSAAGDASGPVNLGRDPEPVWDELERLNRFSVRHFRSAAERKQLRIKLGIAGGLVLLACFAFFMRLWGRPYAHASAVISDQHLASLALDGLDATEWLLPDNTPGWIDIIPPKPRTLQSVRLVNAHNEYWLDRATHKVRVTAYSETGPVGEIEGAFAKFSQDRSVLDLPLKASNVIRVRVEVLSHFKRGGGFAEIELH
ncbi:MAG TPA: hypothetical protein VER96_19625 [Polyangiaceae bacterium]|nr:hypothetical protein [Polyangiaceae bacterium]